jgi:uncharacterized protein (TIGR02611 family)
MDQVKRLARVVAGFALLFAGIAMIALPGPGWVTIALGLALLSRDFPWAEKSLKRLRHVGGRLLVQCRDWLHRMRRRFSGAG